MAYSDLCLTNQNSPKWWYHWISNKIVIDINTMSCPFKVNSNTIELSVHTSCYCVLDLLCVQGKNLVTLFYIDVFKSFQPIIQSQSWDILGQNSLQTDRLTNSLTPFYEVCRFFFQLNLLSSSHLAGSLCVKPLPQKIAS